MIENRTMQVRCTYCNGRLFDIVMTEKNDICHDSKYSIVIKCLKCRQKLNIENKTLVQAPRMLCNTQGCLQDGSRSEQSW